MVTVDFGSARTLLSMSGSCLVSFIIVLFYKKLHNKLFFTPPVRKNNFVLFHVNLGVSLVSFGLLLLLEAALQFFLWIIGVNTTEAVRVLRPKGLGLAIAVLSVLLSATGEELLFRVFFPSALSDLAAFFSSKNKKLQTPLKALALVLGALIFSLPHLYMGTPSAVNALFCHFVLLFCLKKTGSIKHPIAVHASYNLFSVILMTVLGAAV